MATPVIKVTDLAKSYGDTQALKACSLRAYSGEVHAVVGENGSGKSTLAKVLGGIISPDAGRVEVLGERPSNPRAAQRIGIALVMQEILVVDGATVLDNIFVGRDGLVRSPMSKQQKVRVAAELVERLVGASLDLDTTIDSYPLSVRQWVVIARALIGKPKVLVLDEATAALDAASVRRLQEVARELTGVGACVVTVTHRIEELPGFADRATVMRDGVSVGELKAGEITEGRLLEAMSGGLPSRAVKAGKVSGAGACRLRARQLRLRPSAEPMELEVATHEIVGVAALEGHGGQELLEVLSGIRRPADGHVEFCGESGTSSVRSLREAAESGLIYVSGDRKTEGTFPNLSVLDNFGTALYRKSRRWSVIDRSAVRRQFSEQAGALSLKFPGEHAPIGSLSGGNQQKLLIGRALAQAPKVMLLNDPTRGVDIPTKRELYALLRRLAESGMSVVFYSTELEELIAVAQRVLVMRNGSLSTVLEGPALASDALLGALFGQASSQGGLVGATS